MEVMPVDMNEASGEQERFGEERELGEPRVVDLEFGVGESEEAISPITMKDPGAPTDKELEHHSITHLPHRSWCEICVASRSKDRPHFRRTSSEEKGLPEVCFDYAFLGTKDEVDTQAIQVARDLTTHMIFAHHVPRKGMASTHGATEMLKDLAKLGHGKMILKSDNEPALVNVQKEVARLREKETVLENSPPGDSKANGIAERAVQAFGEQFRVVRAALESRLKVRVPGSHCLTS